MLLQKLEPWRASQKRQKSIFFEFFSAMLDMVLFNAFLIQKYL